MNFHELSRRAVLRVPRVRRYYNNVKTIEKELTDLRAERERLSNEARQSLERVSGELAAVSAEKEQLGLDLYVLRSDYQRLVNKIDETRRAESKAHGRVEQLRAELADQHGRYDALSAELTDSRGHLELLKAQLQSESRELEALKAELNAERGRRESLNAELNAERGKHESLNAELNAERGQIEALNTELQTARGKHDAAEIDLAKERARSRTLQAELVQQYGRLEPMEADLARQRERCQSLEGELATERVRREVVEAHAAPRLASAADLEQSYARLLARLYMLSSDLTGVRKLLHGNGHADLKATEALRANYLDLLEAALTGRLCEDASMAPSIEGYNPEIRAIGRDWPAHAQTMIGTTRMRNIRVLAETVLDDGVEGDFLEAGVWRGGACIYMRGILAAHNVNNRRVFVADSFAGLPPPRPDLYPADLNDPHCSFKELVVSLETVKENFARYGLLDSEVVFLPGWFKDTLPDAPIQKLALLRLDGDTYESTIQALENLYYRLSPGGFVIIDDYILKGCRQAVDDFRKVYCCGEPLQEIDGAAVFWRKEAQRHPLPRPKARDAKVISAPPAAAE